MKNFNKLLKYLLSLTVTLSGVCLAGPLTSIGNDTCWYKEGEYRTKIASFNDQVSINTSRDDILAPVVKYVHKRGLDPKGINSIHTYGLCGPQLNLAFRLSYDSVEYCLRASIDQEGQVNIDNAQELTLASQRKGACEAINSSRLIVSITSELVVDLQKHLSAQGYEVKKAQHLSASVYVLDFVVKKDEIKRIKDSIESSGLAKSVSFSSGQYHIADEFELLSLSYFRK